MKYYLKYYAYRYFNKKHTRLEKWIVCFFVYFFCAVLFIPKSVLSVILDEVQQDDFKQVVRRISWVTANSIIGKKIFSDDYFDFSIGLTTQAAIDAYQLVSKRNKEDAFIQNITLAQLASAVLESQISPGQRKIINELSYSEFDAKYVSHFNEAKVFLDLMPVKKIVMNDASSNTGTEPKRSFDDGKVNLMHKHAFGVLSQLISLFEKENIPVFVISGTFLGLIRDKNFIAHDYDIDLGVFEPDCTDRFINLLYELGGFRMPKFDYPCLRRVVGGEVSYEIASVPALIKLYDSSGVQTDIFVHFRDGDVYWHGSSLHRWDNKIFELEKRDFLGMDVNSPKDYDLYLTENYGDWKTPVKDFNCSTGTPNVMISDSCKTQCYFLKRQYISKK